LSVAKFGGWILKVLKQLFAFVFVDFRWTVWTRFVVGSLLDRFFLEPIEPVDDRSLNDSVALS